MKSFLLVVVLLLVGCNIRAVAILETEDAIYGNTSFVKGQKYDPKQRHLDALESVMGTVNSDSLKALGDILNEKPTTTEPTLP